MDGVGYETLQHPTYSPELTPSNFFVFLNLIKIAVDAILVWLWGQWLKSALTQGSPTHFLNSKMVSLVHHWAKRIMLEGNWIEKRLNLNADWLVTDLPTPFSDDLVFYVSLNIVILR